MGRGQEDASRRAGDGVLHDNTLLHVPLWAGFLLAARTTRGSDPLSRASILTVPIELITVWGAVITFSSATSGLWAWWSGSDVTSCLEDGFIAGFLYGLPITVCAAIAVITWG